MPAVKAALAAVVVACAAPVLASVAAAAGPAPAEPASLGPLESAQDTTLDALGVPSQTLYGLTNSIAVLVPPPAGPLAPAGSVVRLVFSHSPLLDPAGSTAKVLVNGQALGAVTMDTGSADGAVAELKVPARALHGDRVNLLEVRFDVRLAGRPDARPDDPSAFVRVESQTMLRYQLFVPPGTPAPARLDAYPFPLVGAHGPSPARLGLVLPRPAAAADLAAGLQLAADLGRRSAGQQVAPEVVTGGQLDWLRVGGLPALVVGALGRLPAAEPLLRAAGFALRGGTWTAPDGQDVGQDDGVVAAVASPWDRRSPIVLVTGYSDGAVARAAAALTGVAGPPPDGTFALVRPGGAPDPAPTAPRAGDTLTFPTLGEQGQDLEVQGPGRHSISLTFTAPAVDAAGTGDLDLAVGHSPVPAGQGSALGVLIDSVPVGAVPLDQRNEQERTASVRVPGSVLHPGRNTLTLDFVLAGDGAAARMAADARLRLPGPPSGGGLQLLPYPLFGDPGGVRVVLGSADDAVLTGAARVVAALGGRAVATPRLTASSAGDAHADAGVLVLGVPGASADAARVAAAVGLAAPPAAVTGTQPTGAVRELAGGPHPVLWVDGTAPAALTLAGDALARGALAGGGATVDATGRIRTLVPTEPAPSEPGVVAAVKVMTALAASLLLAAVGWQAWRPRKEQQ
jgi:Bacterial cellulose synthase subunit